MKVKELMSDQVVTVGTEESAAVAARLLSRHNVAACRCVIRAEHCGA